MWSMEFLLVVLANMVVDCNSFHVNVPNRFDPGSFFQSNTAEKADNVNTEFKKKTDNKLNELKDEMKNSQKLAEAEISRLETEMKKLANDTKSAVDSQLSSVRKMMDKLAEVCPNLQSVEGGTLLNATGRHVGAQVQFQCTYGERLVVTCLATGEWDTKPECSGTYWESPPLGTYELPSKFGTGSAVTFIAEPLGIGKKWSIFDFKKDKEDKSDILFLTSIRVKERRIVRNSFLNSRIGREESASLSPVNFKVGQPFNFTVVLDKTGYKGYVDGDHSFDFRNRVNEIPQYVTLRGQMLVKSMKVLI